MARPPPRPAAQPYTVPAPMGGLNTAVAGLSIPPTDCVQAYNLIPAENGLRARLGSREWVTGIELEGEPLQVRSSHAFVGSSSTALFAMSREGITVATASTQFPAIDVGFPIIDSSSGYGVSTNFTTAGGHYLLYADESNGLYVYSESGGSWSKVTQGGGAGQIDGLDPDNIVFVMSFKDRLWFAERGSASAWYLPVGQLFGTVSELPMGVKMRHGGTIVGMWDWTYDGGAGVDDSLVVLSSAGDVLVWQGTDPDDAAAFGLRGVWYVGKPPAGRLVASDFGGDMVLLTRLGVFPMSRLVVGIPDERAEALTVKISNLFNQLMETRAEFRGWSVVRHPEDNTLLITVPADTSGDVIQLVQSVATKGWFLYRDLDMQCAVEWEGQLYFGTSDGRVMRNTGYLDEVLLDDPNAFTSIDFGLITAFTNLGAPVQKQVQLLRPILKVDGVRPAVSLQARYNYGTTPLDPVSLVLGGTSTWNNAVWDVDVWGGDSAPITPVRGATGMGSSVAIILRGTSISRTVVVGVEVLFTAGGWL